jgi:hypothetical protein
MANDQASVAMKNLARVSPKQPNDSDDFPTVPSSISIFQVNYYALHKFL